MCISIHKYGCHFMVSKQLLNEKNDFINITLDDLIE